MEVPVNELLAKLSEQQHLLARQTKELDANEHRSTSSSPTDLYASTPPATEDKQADNRPDAVEVFRLKKELELAQERMAQMNLQLTQSRLAQHTMEEAIGSPFPTAQHLAASIPGHTTMPAVHNLAQGAAYNRAASPFERGSFNISQASQS